MFHVIKFNYFTPMKRLIIQIKLSLFLKIDMGESGVRLLKIKKGR